MAAKRQRLPAEMKAKVALAANRGERTGSEIASQFKVHSAQVSRIRSTTAVTRPNAPGVAVR